MTAALPSLALVRRELLTLLRGPRAFGVLFLFAAAAVAVTIANWPQHTADRWLMQHYGQSLARGFLFLMFGGTVLCLPAFAAGAIVLERERATLDLLRMTLARPAGVVMSKLLNSVGFFILLMFALAPIAATAFFFAGVDVRQFAAGLGVIAATAVFCAAVGLLGSAIARRSLIAIALSYSGIAVLTLLPLVLVFVGAAAASIFLDIRSVAAEMERIYVIVVPLALLVRIMDDGAPGMVLPGIAYQLAVAAVCLAVTHRLVLRPARPLKVESRKPLDDTKILRDRRTTWPYYLVDPLRRKKPIEDGRNPMLVREIRWGLINRGTILVRLFYVAATIYFFVGVMAASTDARDFGTLNAWFATQIVLTVLVAPALTANAVTKELELGNLDMLRVTLLRPGQIILGKLAAGAFTLSPLILAAAVSLLPVAAIMRPDWRIVAVGYTTLAVSALLSLSIAMFFSTALRRTIPALVWSYIASALAFGGLWLGAAWASEFYGIYNERKYVDLWSPLFSLGRVLGSLRSGSPIEGFYSWMAGMAIWSSVAALLLAASVYLFARRRMRDP